jgi:hypothetical protein
MKEKIRDRLSWRPCQTRSTNKIRSIKVGSSSGARELFTRFDAAYFGLATTARGARERRH